MAVGFKFIQELVPDGVRPGLVSFGGNPEDGQSFCSLLCLPVGFGDDRYCLLHPDSAEKSRTVPDRVDPETTNPAAQHRRMYHVGVNHVRQPDIHAVNRRTVDLGGDIQALGRQPEKVEFLWRLDPDISDADLSRKRSDLTKTNRPAAAVMIDAAIVSIAVFRTHHPGFSRSLDQSFPGFCTGQLEILSRMRYRPTATGPHAPVDTVLTNLPADIGVLDPDFSPVGFEFFRHDHGQRCQYALPHFGLGNTDRDGVVRVNGQPGTDLCCRCF